MEGAFLPLRGSPLTHADVGLATRSGRGYDLLGHLAVDGVDPVAELATEGDHREVREVRVPREGVDGLVVGVLPGLARIHGGGGSGGLWGRRHGGCPALLAAAMHRAHIVRVDRAVQSFCWHAPENVPTSL